MPRLTNKEVRELFKAEVMPTIRQKEREYGNGKDVPMRREAFNNFTDMLCKDGRITARQYESIAQPRVCNW